MRFRKYQGLGNDFVLLDRRAGGGPIEPARAVAWCDRRRGIGADGVLTLLPSSTAAATMHVTNADGSVAEMCGNGLRCVVKYLCDEAGVRGDRLEVETGAGVLTCEVFRGADGKVTEVGVDMGAPVLEPRRIPMRAGGERFVRGTLKVGAEAVVGTAVSMGNPHLVLFETPLDAAPRLGPALETHEAFPARANIEFARLESGGLRVRVWERGCGFTQACGTGACAAVVAAVVEGRLASGEEVPVQLDGGVLRVRVAPDLSRVWMRGPAERVFDGELP